MAAAGWAAANEIHIEVNMPKEPENARCMPVD
ncbi:hypothetical protein GGR60_003108 [Xanthomonas arboricola]|nr:hypothetical protein [Xanthomonas euroxanthea]